MKPTNKTQYALLGMLAIAPMSGYEIRQTMRASTSNFWSENDGQIYPTLIQLQKQGHIVAKADDQLKRQKKIYHISTTGRKKLAEWLEKESDKQTIRNELLLKLFFGANVPPAISLEHVEAHQRRAKALLAHLTEKQQELNLKYAKSPHLPYWLMTVEYGITSATGILGWCESTIKKLNKIKTRKKI